MTTFVVAKRLLFLGRLGRYLGTSLRPGGVAIWLFWWSVRPPGRVAASFKGIQRGVNMSRKHLRRGPARGSGRGSAGSGDIRVMVVDDYAFARAGLRAMLESENGIQVTEEIESDGVTAVRWKGAPPDVAVMPVLAGRGSIQAISQVQARWPDTRVLALIPATDDEAVLATIQAGATGCVPAKVSAGELAHAVRHVAAGQRLIDQAMVAPVFEEVRRRQTTEDKLARLSLDEQRVAGLLVQGQTNREIAQQLGNSLATVKKRVSSILSKLEMSRRAEVVAHLAQRQLPGDASRGT